MCGTGSGTDQGATCSTLVAGGSCVDVQISSGTPPVGTGGTLAAGTYNLTSETFYGPGDAGTAYSRQETVILADVTATSFTFQDVRVSGTQTSHVNGTATVSGTTLTYTFTCPPPTDGGMTGGSEDFTATSTSFTVVQSQNGGTVVDVYMKVP